MATDAAQCYAIGLQLVRKRFSLHRHVQKNRSTGLNLKARGNQKLW